MGVNVGDVIGGDFQIEERAGSGTAGDVYRARQHSIDRLVAIKMLSTDNVLDAEEAIENCRAEASDLATVAHEQVPTVYVMGLHTDGTPYIAMEWLEGRSLARRLRKDGPLAEGAALRVIEQLCRPLARAHERGLLHRDLKPANIFELPDGAIKLIDFGVAKHFGVAAARGKRKPTEHQFLKGTYWFMAPETARHEAIDARADVYGLGATLYTLLTGRLPFEDRYEDQNYQLINALARGERPNDVRTQGVFVRDVVAELVAKMMAPDRDARFSSVEEVMRAVYAIYASRKQSRVRRALPVVVALVIACAVSGVVGALLARRRGATIAPTAVATPAPQTPIVVAPTLAPPSPSRAQDDVPPARDLPARPTAERKPHKRTASTVKPTAEEKKAPTPDESDMPHFGGR